MQLAATAVIDIDYPSSPQDIYIARRNDGKPGSGTVIDPYDGSTPERFDKIFREAPMYARINIGPGLYYTFGSCGGNADFPNPEWVTFKEGWEIVGAGMGKTNVLIISGKLIPNKKTYWICPPYNYQSANNVTVRDLTINCGFSKDSPENTNVGGLWNIGSHCTYRNVEVTHFGSKWQECYPLAMGVGRDAKSTQLLVEGCKVHKLGFIDPGKTFCSAICLMAQYQAPSLLIPPDDKTYLYESVTLFGNNATVRNCTVDLHNEDGSISLTQGIVIPGSMPATIESNYIAGCFVGGPWQDTEPVQDCVFKNNTLWNCRFSICTFRGYRANSPMYKTHRLIIDGNMIYNGKPSHWPGEFPIAILLLGDHSMYSFNYNQLPKEFYTTDFIRVSNNVFGFVQGRYGLHNGLMPSPDSPPLPYTTPPKDPNNWDAPVPETALAVVITRVQTLEFIHNTFSNEFIRKYPIRLRGVKNLYLHGNRIGAKMAYASVFKTDDGTYGLFDIPKDGDYVTQLTGS